MKEFAGLPVVQTHLKLASDMVGRRAGLKFLESMGGYLRHMDTPALESPLEVLFWLWWHACAEASWPRLEELYLEDQVVVEVQTGECFRLDFVVGLTIPPEYKRAFDAGMLSWPKIAVEVDGHEFHERTKEQVATRDRRDRLLQQAGWTVFHYSWSEFTKEPERCVSEVFDLASSTFVELMRVHALELPPEFRGE